MKEICLFVVSVPNYIPVILPCRRIPLPKAFIKFTNALQTFKGVRYYILAVKNRNKFIPHLEYFAFFVVLCLHLTIGIYFSILEYLIHYVSVIVFLNPFQSNIAFHIEIK